MLDSVENRFRKGLCVVFAVRLAGSVAPDWTGPCRISGVAGDNMQMQLPDNIAERSCIDLFTIGNCFECLCRDASFECQHGLIKRRQVMDLGDSRPLRHEDKPRPALIIHQAKVTKAQLDDGKCIGV